eukprot:252883_1
MWYIQHLCLIGIFCIIAIIEQNNGIPETWSGGWAGVILNGTELEIYSVSSPIGGVFTHFWITGQNKSNIDNAIVSMYIDNELIPSVQFQINLGSGTGFIDDTTECKHNNCSEKNSNWGNIYIGKGSGMGGWYNKIKIPFNK